MFYVYNHYVCDPAFLLQNQINLIFYVFLRALLISVDIPSVFLLLPFGTNYPPLSGYWTHLNFD